MSLPAPRRCVAIVQRFLPRYRQAFYEQLRVLLAARDVELILVHSTPPGNPYGRGDAAHIAWAIDVPAREVTLLGQTALWQPLAPQLRTADLVIVEQASRLLLNYVLLLRQLLRRRRVAFWGHGRSFHDQEPSAGPRERLKRWVSRHVHWWFAYNDLTAEVVRDFGFPTQRLTVVQNSTDTTSLRRLAGALTPDAIDQARHDLGLGNGKVGLFVGNFSAEKQLEFLFAASDHLHRLDPGFSLLLVGEGPERPLVERLAGAREHVRFVGSRFDAELARCFAVADALLIPGWAGLVVVDAFAAGVPVVASASFPHPPEISYVVSGGNGVLVDDDADPSLYAERVHRLLHDPEEHAALVAGCATAAEVYSTEAMAARFADGILAALDTPLRRPTGRL